MKRLILVLAFALIPAAASQSAPAAVKVATFDVDATPPLGSAMAYDPVKRHDELTLRCRGIVIVGAGKPIVLCAVDWIGIANEGHDVFRESLAAAAGTTRDRVAVHTLHQHDAPGCDFTAERLIRDLELKNFGRFEGGFHRDVIQRAAKAIKAAMDAAQPVTHYGWGVATVKEVASNRRILGPDGKVRAVRYTATKDPALRAEPEGVIDPELSLLSFWNENRPIAVLSYYACSSAELLSNRYSQPRFSRHRPIHPRPGGSRGPARSLQRRRRKHRCRQIQRRHQGEPHGARPAPGRWNEASPDGHEEAAADRRRHRLGNGPRQAAGGSRI